MKKIFEHYKNKIKNIYICVGNNSVEKDIYLKLKDIIICLLKTYYQKIFVMRSILIDQDNIF